MSTKILSTLHDLYYSENKPDSLQPLDLALVTYLVLRQSEDHFVYDSQDTLAQRLGCERKAIGRSIKRLEDTKWITTKETWQFNQKTKRRTRALAKTIGLAVNLSALPRPADRAKRSGVSEDAKDLAAEHTAILKQLKKRRHPKSFQSQQEHAAQRILDAIGDYDRADVLNFALHDKRFTKAVQASLYEVRLRLKAILKAFEADLGKRTDAA